MHIGRVCLITENAYSTLFLASFNWLPKTETKNTRQMHAKRLICKAVTKALNTDSNRGSLSRRLPAKACVGVIAVSSCYAVPESWLARVLVVRTHTHSGRKKWKLAVWKSERSGAAGAAFRSNMLGDVIIVSYLRHKHSASSAHSSTHSRMHSNTCYRESDAFVYC